MKELVTIDESSDTQIRVERTGGFAGLTVARKLDTRDLEEDELAYVHSLLTSSLACGDVDAPKAPDGFRYVITVEQDEARKVITLSEPHAPEPCVEMAKYVLTHGEIATRRY